MFPAVTLGNKLLKKFTFEFQNKDPYEVDIFHARDEVKAVVV